LPHSLHNIHTSSPIRSPHIHYPPGTRIYMHFLQHMISINFPITYSTRRGLEPPTINNAAKHTPEYISHRLLHIPHMACSLSTIYFLFSSPSSPKYIPVALFPGLSMMVFFFLSSFLLLLFFPSYVYLDRVSRQGILSDWNARKSMVMNYSMYPMDCKSAYSHR